MVVMGVAAVTERRVSHLIDPFWGVFDVRSLR